MSVHRMSSMRLLLLFLVVTFAVISFSGSSMTPQNPSSLLPHQRTGAVAPPSVLPPSPPKKKEWLPHLRKQKPLPSSKNSKQQLVCNQSFVSRTLSSGSISVDDWAPSPCADDSAWIGPYLSQGHWRRLRHNLHLSPSSSPLRLVDVGANKGYTIANWLDILGLHPVTTPQSSSPSQSQRVGIELYKLALHQGSAATNSMKAVFMSLCGGCCECAAPKVPPQSLHNGGDREEGISVDIYGFEPAPANSAFLMSVFGDGQLQYKSSNATVSSSVNIVHAAVTSPKTIAASFKMKRGTADSKPTVPFPNVTLGTEVGSIGGQEGSTVVDVPAVTLDHYFRNMRGFVIDVLVTDCEGHDKEAMEGAKRLLREGRVAIYQFELNGKRDEEAAKEKKGLEERREMTTEETMSQLEGWGYVCYVAVKQRIRHNRRRHKHFPALLRVNYGCWQPVFEYKLRGWSNVVCYNSRLLPAGPAEDYDGGGGGDVPFVDFFEKSDGGGGGGGEGNCPTQKKQQATVMKFIDDFRSEIDSKS